MKTQQVFGAALGCAALAVVPLAGAQAAEGFPGISGAVAIEVQDDWFYDTDDQSEGNDLYTTIEPEVTVAFSPALSLVAGLTLEPVEERDAGNDRLFDDHGLYVSTLQFVYEGDGWAAHAGKFTAPFGLAHDVVAGLYGDTFSGTYELVERLGLGGSASFAVPGVATVGVAAAMMKKDTTFLAESAITSRDRLDESDGGGGNTDTIENVSAIVDVTDIAGLPGLIVRASFLRQAGGEGDAEDQTAWGLGAAWEIDAGNGVTLAPMVEYVAAEEAVGINDALIISGASESVLTGGIGLGYGPWNAAVAGGSRDVAQPGQADAEETFAQISAGYAFDNGLTIDVGWLTQDADGTDTRTLGVLVAYGLEF